MSTESASPIALFVAISRALRDAPIPPALRAQAFDALERAARRRITSEADLRASELMRLAAQHPALARALQPYRAQLQRPAGDALDQDERS